MSAIDKAVKGRYPNVSIMGFMESGRTDGIHFKAVGIPTWGISSAFMNHHEMFAHGLNERLPISTFYDGLEHLSIIIKELAGKK